MPAIGAAGRTGGLSREIHRGREPARMIGVYHREMTRCAGLLALVALAAPALAQSEPPAVITLERTACFGTCPVYAVRITSDGRVDYEGKQFVRVTGRASATIPPSEFASLARAFEQIGYFALDESYRFIAHADGSRSSVTDLPTTITSIRIGERFKQVVDYVGAPAALRDLERRIDATAGTMRWISVTPDVVRQLQRGGWNAAGEDGADYLRHAVQRGDADTVAVLLQAGADPNSGSLPPIFLTRDPAVIAMLANGGADVNHVMLTGETPLMWAARNGVAAAVRALLQAGARVNAAREGDGKTALQIAIDTAAHPPPPFPGSDPAPAEFEEIVALLRAAGAK
jgi:hypothetical protein